MAARQRKGGEVLIERERELAAAQLLLDGLEKGRGGCLAISGELGIGKTRLAAEVRNLAELRGHRVRSGRATAAGADDLMGGDLLESVAEERPLALVLEDLQWADQSSCELVSDLLGRGSDGQVVTVITCRSGQWPIELPAGDDIAHVQISPLTAEGTDALLGDRHDRPTRRRIHRVSGGNPFYALELVEAESADEALPSMVDAAISEDAASLSPEARALLNAAAVAGDVFALEVAMAVAGLTGRAAEGALDELSDRRLLDGRAGRFRAPIVRRAVYESMGMASRLAAHRRTAHLLGARNGSVAERAHHVERGGRPGQIGVALLLAAAQSLHCAQPQAGARWFASAARHMRDDDERRFPTLLDTSAALLAAGRVAEGRATFEEVEATLPRRALDDPHTVVHLARVEHMLGRSGPSRAPLRRALESGLPPSLAASAGLALAMSHWRVGERDDMVRQARLAVAAARVAGEDFLVANSVGLLGLAEYTCGQTTSAVGHVEDAELMVGRIPDADPAGLPEALLVVGYLNYGLERYSHAAAHFERGIRLCREIDSPYFLVPLTAGRAAVELATGRLDDAWHSVVETREVAERSGGQQLLMWVQTLATLIAAAQGRISAALEAGRGAAAAADGIASGFLTSAARCALGAAQVYATESHQGEEQILRHAGGPGLDRLDTGSRPGCYVVLAKAARQLGDLDRAGEWVERAEGSAAKLGLGGAVATAAAARARLLLEQEPGRAARLADDSTEAFEAVGRMADAAWALTIAGRAHALRGDDDRAISALERGFTLATDCGAERLRDIAALGLRRLGRPASRPPERGSGSTGIGALSRREREVAELVAKGFTNQRIADELFVSARTVEDHLARAFVKLGVSSRAGVAAAVENARVR